LGLLGVTWGYLEVVTSITDPQVLGLGAYIIYSRVGLNYHTRLPVKAITTSTLKSFLSLAQVAAARPCKLLSPLLIYLLMYLLVSTTRPSIHPF
jgi:hypothetical protein